MGDSQFTIYVYPKDATDSDRMNPGILPDNTIIKEGRAILRKGDADFTRVAGKGLYKATIHLLVDSLPQGTRVIASINHGDTLNHLAEAASEPGVKDTSQLLGGTLIGHVYQTARVSKIELSYKYFGEHRTYAGLEALKQMSMDRKQNRYNGDLRLIVTK